MMQPQRRTLEKRLVIGELDRENGYGCRRARELFRSPGKRQPVSLFDIAGRCLIGLALIIVAIAYPKRSQTASKATQENFETIAADLRNRALEVKKQDEGLRKRDLEVKERKQQQVLKRSQRALKGSVSRTMLQKQISKGLSGPSMEPEDGGVKNVLGWRESPWKQHAWKVPAAAV